jgi:NAD(P)-dependent dehydrogenase (short-subunit alcohol dehydrogenase family)
MKGKSFIVVGGSSGIGWGILQRMSAEGAHALNLSRARQAAGSFAGCNPYYV